MINQSFKKILDTSLQLTPQISVITPAYNASHYISKAIESVQAQTFLYWEMIVVDDSSTDGTCEIVEKYAVMDSRIKLIRQTENGGPAKARNVALSVASSRYVAFLDCDDMWLPEKLAHQLLFMVERKIAFSYTLYRQFSDEPNYISGLVSLPISFNYNGLLKNTGIACLTVMIDTELTGPIRMESVRHEDYVLWLKLLKNQFIAYGLMEDLARYRISKTSVSGNKFKSATWVWKVYRDIERLNFLYAFWCLLNYGWRAYRKHRS